MSIPTDAERMRVLDLIDSGQLTAAEGVQRLHALAPSATATAAVAAGLPAPARRAAYPPEIQRWRRWWVLPLSAGSGLSLLGAGLLLWAYQAGAGALAWAGAALPLAVGLLAAALALVARSARWVHIRVNTGQAEWPRRIALSFPLPIRLTAWALRRFGPRLPHLREHGVDELLLALAENTSLDAPLYVGVEASEHGEQVQVYIG